MIVQLEFLRVCEFVSAGLSEKTNAHSQVVQHVGHISPVVQRIPVGLLSLCHLSLVLQDISQVSPSYREKQERYSVGGFSLKK